jgi:hypothetical protein
MALTSTGPQLPQKPVSGIPEAPVMLFLFSAHKLLGICLVSPPTRAREASAAICAIPKPLLGLLGIGVFCEVAPFDKIPRSSGSWGGGNCFLSRQTWDTEVTKRLRN